jgi:2-polyprenyl-6-methoxyphenol hydroxylase-like FAD-dependent oxidoreductase
MHSTLLRRSLSNLKGPGKNYNILVVGGGIAGPALAFFLHRYGMKPVVVERAPELRLSGQWVDLQAEGKEVAWRMGIESKVREKITEEQGTHIVDSAGRPQASFDANSFGEKDFVEEIEIRRPELANILYEQLRNHVEFIFGDSPQAIDDRGDRVQVKFANGNLREFDLVVGADGIHSKTRRLVFGDESPISYADLYAAFFDIPRSDSDGSWVRFYSAPGGRSVALRPYSKDRTQVYLCFRSKERGYENLDVDLQKRLIQKLFADVSFEAPRILRELPNLDDFYFDSIGQVKMDRWSKGRVTLVGDAGYSPSPLTGMGANVALVGAYILAGELSRHQDYSEAFKQYETWMRPYVTKAQKIIPGSVRLALPNTRTAIILRNAVLGFVFRPAITRFIAKLITSKAPQKSVLPNYEAVSTS